MAKSTSAVAPFGALTIFRIVNIFAALPESLAAWNATRKTIQQLNALSDTELDDIGLSRGEIPNVARGRF